MRKPTPILAVAMMTLSLSAAGVCRAGESAVDRAMSQYLAASGVAPASAQAYPAGIDAARGASWLAMSEQYAAAETAAA
ncbi:unnamed protein product, partial [marine sediment metagenome]